MDGFEGTGEIEEHHPYSAPSIFQVREGSVYEVEDSVIYPIARLIGELKWVQQWAQQGLEMSRVFDRWYVRATGLYLLKSLGCGIFSTGTTQDVFHS